MELGGGTVDNDAIYKFFKVRGYGSTKIFECNFKDMYNRAIKWVEYINNVLK